MAFRDSIYEPEHVHTAQEGFLPPPDHLRMVLVPLLATRTRGESQMYDLAEFALGQLPNMVGVGTAARASKIDTEFRRMRHGC